MRGRRNRTSEPLSLFSLQDIITCLTGIMILIVLILALEAMMAPEERAVGVHVEVPDLAYMENRLQELQQKKMELLQTLARREPLDPTLTPADRVRKVIEMRQRLSFLEQLVRDQNLARQKLGEKQIPILNEVHRIREELKALRGENKKWAEIAVSAPNWVTFLPGKGMDKTPHLLVVDAHTVNVISLGEPDRSRQWNMQVNENSLKTLMTDANRTREYFIILLKPSGALTGLEMYQTLRKAGFNAGYDTLEEDALVLTPEVLL